MKYFLYKIRSLRTFITVFCILALISYPLFCGALGVYATERDRYYTMSNSDYYQLPENYAEFNEAIERYDSAGSVMRLVILISLSALAVLFVGSAAVAIRSFRYLYSREHADKELMIPVTAKTRFFGDFFSGLAVSLIPHITAVLVGVVILAVMHPAALVFDVIFDNAELIYKCMISGVIMCAELYCITVLMISVCGKLSKVIRLTVLINVAIPVITVCAGFISVQNACGIDPETYSLDDMPWTYIFMPGGMLAELFTSLFMVSHYGGSLEIGYGAFDIQFGYYLAALVFCVILTAAAYFLIKNRRSERTGNAYVYRYARAVTAGIAVLSLTLFFCAELFTVINGSAFSLVAETFAPVCLIFVAGWLLLSFAFYVCVEFIDREKTHSLRVLAKYPLYAAGSLAVVLLLYFSQGFGAAWYIPDVGSITSAKATLYINNIYIPARVIEDQPEMLEKLTELHSEVINGVPSAMPGEDRSSFNVTYHLDDGTDIYRRYSLDDSFTEKAFAFMAGSEADIVGFFDDMTENGAKSGKAWIKTPGGNTDISLSELEAALGEDIRSATADKLKSANRDDEMMITVCFLTSGIDYSQQFEKQMIIYPFYEKTLIYLRSCGADI